MKKKFNFWIIFFIFNVLSFNAYALDSRCNSLFKSIINNELNLQFDELDYNKTTDGVSKAEASIYVTIKNISQIDVKDNTFESDLVLSVSWKMNNLYPLSKEHMILNKGKFEYWYCIFTPEEFEKMQIGEVFFETINSVKQNENLIKDEYKFNISNYLYDSSIYSVTDFKDENKDFIEITHEKKGNFTFSNDYNLKAFPFDRQLLKIKVADLTRSKESLELLADNYTNKGLESFKLNGKILEWKIIDAHAKYYNEENSIDGSISSGLEIILEIERNFQYYIFKIICPIILILLVCWSVFWIHPKELESKLTITIVCLLSLIAYNFVIDKDLPKLSYLTILDYIVLLSYVFATIPNFISIYSFEKHRVKNPVWKIIDKKSRVYGPATYLILVFFIIFINSFNNENTSAFLGFLR